VVYLKRCDEPALCRLATHPGIDRGIALILKMAGEQQLLTEDCQRLKDITLHDAADFRSAARSLTDAVRGHDAVIAALMGHLERTIRRRRCDAHLDPRPFGIFLLVGGDGIGKRHLASALHRSLFHSGGFLVVERAHYSDPGSLFGTEKRSGALLTAVKNQPHCTILLQNIDSAPESILEFVTRILGEGFAIDPANGARVSMQNCLFLLTTAKSWKPLLELKMQFSDESRWDPPARKLVEDGTSLKAPLLSVIHKLLLCEPPSSEIKAEVVTLLMRSECQKYGKQLRNVSTAVIKEEVMDINDSYGFQTVPGRIQSLLLEPIRRSQDDHSPYVTV
jgi:hypothetical protein